jgi:hypothetical protein
MGVEGCRIEEPTIAALVVVVVASRAGVACVVGVTAIRSYLAVALVSVLFVRSSHGQQV